MQRRSFIQSGSLSLAIPSLPAWFKILMPNPFEMKLLRRNVGIFTERGGTIGWMIHPEAIVVVDSQWKEQAAHLLDEIRKQEDAPLEFLINTHHHGDHTSGNIAFKGIAKNILAHENSKINQMAFAEKNNATDQLFPDMTYTDRWQQTVGDEYIDIQYWGPAHTNGDSIIHFQHANIVHCGDLMFNRRHPVIDKNTGARIDNWIEILQQMQSYFDNDTLFIFGHARQGIPVTGNKDDLAAFADYLTAIMEYVSLQIKDGKTREEIFSITLVPGAPEWTGEGLQRSLKAAMLELGVE